MQTCQAFHNFFLLKFNYHHQIKDCSLDNSQFESCCCWWPTRCCCSHPGCCCCCCHRNGRKKSLTKKISRKGAASYFGIKTKKMFVSKLLKLGWTRRCWKRRIINFSTTTTMWQNSSTTSSIFGFWFNFAQVKVNIHQSFKMIWDWTLKLNKNYKWT